MICRTGGVGINLSGRINDWLERVAKNIEREGDEFCNYVCPKGQEVKRKKTKSLPVYVPRRSGEYFSTGPTLSACAEVAWDVYICAQRKRHPADCLWLCRRS